MTGNKPIQKFSGGITIASFILALASYASCILVIIGVLSPVLVIPAMFGAFVFTCLSCVSVRLDRQINELNNDD